MATLCRMCAGDNAGSSVSLLDTSHHHLQWAIKRFDIELDDVLPTSVCLRCDAIILEWTSFLRRREKARSLFSTMIANQPQLTRNVPPSSVPGTEGLQHPQEHRQRTPRPHTSSTSVPSRSSGHCAASIPGLSLPQHLVTEYPIKDSNIRVPRLSDQVLDPLQQNGIVDCNVVDSQMPEQRDVRIKLEPVDPCDCNDQVSGNLQQNLSSTEDADDMDVPFEAVYVPVIVKCEPDLVISEPSSDLSADQYEYHHLADGTAVTVKQEVIGNAEEYSDVQPGLPSPETSNPGQESWPAICSHVHPNNCSYKCLQCAECGKILSSNQALAEHKMTIHTKSSPLSCGMCSKIFYTEESLNSHKREVHCNLSNKCDVCHKSFANKSYLRRHQQFVHASVRAFSCNECEKTFVSKCKLKRHSLVHSDLRPFECDKCGLCFKEKSQYNYHIRVIHSDVRDFKCHLCAKSYKSKGNLKKHLISHSDVRDYKCEQCGKLFKTKSELKLHLIRHSEIRPFACDQCHKTFKFKADLEQHLRVHSDVRPFSCDKCSLAFKSKTELKLHQPVHSNVCEFECHHCKSKFKYRRDLRVHQNKHPSHR